MQHAGDAMKAERSDGGWCCRNRKNSRRPVTEQMLVRMRDKKSGVWQKTQRNEGGWACRLGEMFATVAVRAEGGDRRGQEA